MIESISPTGNQAIPGEIFPLPRCQKDIRFIEQQDATPFVGKGKILS